MWIDFFTISIFFCQLPVMSSDQTIPSELECLMSGELERQVVSSPGVGTSCIRVYTDSWANQRKSQSVQTLARKSLFSVRFGPCYRLKFVRASDLCSGAKFESDSLSNISSVVRELMIRRSHIYTCIIQNVCIYVYIYISVYISNKCVHIYIYISIYICMYVYANSYMYVYKHTYKYVYVYTNAYIHIYIYICIYICMYIHIYIHTYIYIYIYVYIPGPYISLSIYKYMCVYVYVYVYI